MEEIKSYKILGHTFQDEYWKPTRVGNGIYQRCGNCGDIIKLNKFILGDIHVCS